MCFCRFQWCPSFREESCFSGFPFDSSIYSLPQERTPDQGLWQEHRLASATMLRPGSRARTQGHLFTVVRCSFANVYTFKECTRSWYSLYVLPVSSQILCYAIQALYPIGVTISDNFSINSQTLRINVGIAEKESNIFFVMFI